MQNIMINRGAHHVSVKCNMHEHEWVTSSFAFIGGASLVNYLLGQNPVAVLSAVVLHHVSKCCVGLGVCHCLGWLVAFFYFCSPPPPLVISGR